MTAGLDVDVIVRTSGPGWRKAWPSYAREAKALIHHAVDAVPVTRAGLVEVEFTTNAAVMALNFQFRGLKKPTNVLSFSNPHALFGGVALAYETVAAEAEAQGKLFSFHAKHLVLHGFLHLLGFDHETVMDRRLMERLETRILGAMGIPNPYFLAK